MGAAAHTVKEIDQLYSATDKVYGQFASSCGLSNCAYWMIYDLVSADGDLPLTELSAAWGYSKQTINSALKSLESQELVTLAFCEGSRRNKRAVLTAKGARFAEANIEPAIAAERRALLSLDPGDRADLVRTLRRYTAALEREFSKMTGGEES
ncbi:MAG: winged helix-turn-helix transcriptional regulator [Coriobacteriaceae bacterium]|nr:winged helix-turn-helix transcriptional regulator [Coriobacteriaceae bacterium]